MQGEYQSSQPQTAVIDDSYSYFESSERQKRKSPEAQTAAAYTFRYRVLKRIFDILLVLVSLPVLLPLLAVISALVVLSSRGPVFYSHRRIRQSGVFFSMWKFRTMCDNSAEVLEDYLRCHPEARAEWSRTHKLKRDPRITSVGRLLRRYSMDELPQVWNVVRGQMTLVGTTADRGCGSGEIWGRFRPLLSREAGANGSVAGLWAQRTHLSSTGCPGLRLRGAVVAPT